MSTVNIAPIPEQKSLLDGLHAAFIEGLKQAIKTGKLEVPGA